jgi:hypothetical protein
MAETEQPREQEQRPAVTAFLADTERQMAATDQWLAHQRQATGELNQLLDERDKAMAVADLAALGADTLQDRLIAANDKVAEVQGRLDEAYDVGDQEAASELEQELASENAYVDKLMDALEQAQTDAQQAHVDADQVYRRVSGW